MNPDTEKRLLVTRGERDWGVGEMVRGSVYMGMGGNYTCGWWSLCSVYRRQIITLYIWNFCDRELILKIVVRHSNMIRTEFQEDHTGNSVEKETSLKAIAVI